MMKTDSERIKELATKLDEVIHANKVLTDIVRRNVMAIYQLRSSVIDLEYDNEVEDILR